MFCEPYRGNIKIKLDEYINKISEFFIIELKYSCHLLSINLCILGSFKSMSDNVFGSIKCIS